MSTTDLHVQLLPRGLDIEDSDLDSFPFAGDSPPNPAATPKKCYRHVWLLSLSQETTHISGIVACSRCGRVKDEAASRRGRTSRRAGNDAERAIAKAYPDGKRTGQFGGPDDVTVGELFVIQSKAGGWFSERVWAELVKLQGSTRIPTLVISDRPGAGHRTRRYVVRTLDDDLALHGPTGGTSE